MEPRSDNSGADASGKRTWFENFRPFGRFGKSIYIFCAVSGRRDTRSCYASNHTHERAPAASARRQARVRRTCPRCALDQCPCPPPPSAERPRALQRPKEEVLSTEPKVGMQPASRWRDRAFNCAAESNPLHAFKCARLRPWRSISRSPGACVLAQESAQIRMLTLVPWKCAAHLLYVWLRRSCCFFPSEGGWVMPTHGLPVRQCKGKTTLRPRLFFRISLQWKSVAVATDVMRSALSPRHRCSGNRCHLLAIDACCKQCSRARRRRRGR